MDVAIQEVTKFNEQKAAEIKKKAMTRACTITSVMLGKRLFAYFDKWRCMSENGNIVLNRRIRSRIYKMYYDYMRSYFTAWKKGG